MGSTEIVTTTLRRIPGLAIAVVALGLSASLVFAGQPAGAASGLANASTHSGKTVPVLAASDGISSDADTETEGSTEPVTDTETSSADHCNVDLTQDPSVLAALNHGSVVCTAAHMATPSGFANHGAWVKSWAHLGKGGADASTKKHGNSSH